MSSKFTLKNISVDAFPFLHGDDSIYVGFPRDEYPQRSRRGQDDQPGDISRVKSFIVIRDVQ